MTFKIANIRDDYDILLKAKEDSEEYLNCTTNIDSLKLKLINSMNNNG